MRVAPRTIIRSGTKALLTHLKQISQHLNRVEQMKSNVEKGQEFTEKARQILEKTLGIKFDREVGLLAGSKNHPFDLVSINRNWFVECKNLAWREKPDYIPRAKITSITKDAGLLQSLASKGRKAIILSRAPHPEKKETLAEYYFRLHKDNLNEVMLGEIDIESSLTNTFNISYFSSKAHRRSKWRNNFEITKL